jgi:hypothetical protein
MRLTFHARQTRFHSLVTLRKPRSENCLNPSIDLHRRGILGQWRWLGKTLG